MGSNRKPLVAWTSVPHMKWALRFEVRTAHFGEHTEVGFLLDPVLVTRFLHFYFAFLNSAECVQATSTTVFSFHSGSGRRHWAAVFAGPMRKEMGTEKSWDVRGTVRCGVGSPQSALRWICQWIQEKIRAKSRKRFKFVSFYNSVYQAITEWQPTTLRIGLDCKKS